MSQRWWIILIVILMMAILWSLSRNKSSPKTTSIDNVEVENARLDTDATQADAAEELATAPVLSGVTQKIQENFSQALITAQACFKFQNSLQATEGDPSLENWKSVLRTELGDVVLEAEDWVNTHLVLSNGEKRRIRIESEMGEDNRVTRKLKYASVDKEDLPVPIELPQEQTIDPNDTFVASLEKEGQVSMVEKASRLYYSDGSEVMSVQRNNIISEIEINRSGRSFHCWNLDKEKHQCDCL